jgi:hypothetical protein
VHLEVQDPAGRVVKGVVVAEARVAGGSQVCDRAAQAGADGSGGFAGSHNPCIAGAEYDAARNLYVITRGRDGNLANGREAVSVVGRPYAGPSGGNDCIVGGKGNDAINISTAGPAAKIKWGKGKDTVGYNHDDRRRVKGCERRYSIK